jgi:hypothetical protein
MMIAGNKTAKQKLNAFLVAFCIKIQAQWKRLNVITDNVIIQ